MVFFNLSTNLFTGEVPAFFLRLTALKSLLLDTNFFSGAYPAAGISRLAVFFVLTLANNPFAPGPFFLELGELTKLNYLWMSRMNLNGEIPEAFSSLTELTQLRMSSNNLTGAIPAWLLRHGKLEHLYLFGNGLTGELPRNVTVFFLIELDLSMNHLTGFFLEAFRDLRKLTLLFFF
ncbi:hypothetical protein BAE44_0019716 [Dichanthelium oligosanthes]|uniref:Uncharacterized protein n=1 Tax=Dichanthelium oligosanthes TaxID=888268 RepID=A0A1E5V272_9POAL|nr:hypothetical protein BAE44_0019716 [Dichanthelium oligosanthes]